MHPAFHAGSRPRRHSTGFSLIEIMVGIVIGMVGIIVMMQVFSLSEERKRTTTGGGDAMTEGVMGLHAVQRDMRQGGYGFAAKDMFGCTVTLSGKSIALAPVTINPATTIIPAGDDNTDTLLVIYGNPEGQPQGQTGTVAVPALTYYVQNAPCATLAITKTVAATSVAAATTLYDLGTSPKALAYAIRGGNLTVCDYVTTDCSDAANAVPVANNIVSLRAQYGLDTAAGTMDGNVDTYKESMPSSPATACEWSRASAVRVALVARSAQFEKTNVTTAAPVWEGTSADHPTGSTAHPIDLSGNASWQNYRYKVFQTIVPLRNVAWLGVVSGC